MRGLKTIAFFVFVMIAININVISFQKQFGNVEENLQTKETSPCHFVPIHPPCSTRRDVLFMYGTNSNDGLFLAIKSLRATGSKCRIVILAPSVFNASKEFLNFAKLYDIEIYNNCDMKRDAFTIPHMLRYEYEAKWIEEHIHELDRVIHADGYDVFYQSDPFMVIGDKKGLIFIQEEIMIFSCEWNSNWVIDCYGRQEQARISYNNIICSGVILGTAIDYLRFVKYMISRPEWTRCWEESMDQPIVNYLYYTGLLKDIGINSTLYSCNDNVLNMQWCLYGRNPQISERGYTLSPNGKNEPAILHQYNRFEEHQKYLGELCDIHF